MGIEEIYCLGIDSSTVCTGIAVLKYFNKKFELVYHEKIMTKDKDSYVEKCNFIYSRIKEVYIKYNINNVAIELLNVRTNLDTTRKLAGLWGFIINSMYKEFGQTVSSMNTMTVKKIATGDGGADKQKVIKFINKKFGTKFKFSKKKSESDDDICDAISVSMASLILNGDNKEKQ